GKEQVLRFEIAMHDAEGMRFRDSASSLPHIVDGEIGGQRVATLKLGAKVMADEQLHRNVGLAIRAPVDVVHASDVPATQLRGSLWFLGKARPCRRVTRELGLEELQRDGLAKVDVLRFVDEAHPACSKPAANAVLSGEGLPLDEPSRRE